MAVPAERIQLPTPFPVGGVNAYYLEGDTPSLVDTGTATPDAWRALADALRGRAVDLIVVTHGHVDHFGQASRLADEFGAEVAVHADDAKGIRRFDEATSERLEEYADGLRRAGLPEAERTRMRADAHQYDAWGHSVAPDRLLQDGQRLTLGKREYDVVHAPGHTPGSALLRASDGDHTFTGDTILETITPNALSVAERQRDALPTYLDTLGGLADEDLGRIFPGHGAPFDDHRGSIRRALRHAELRQQRVLRVLSGPRTAYDVAVSLFTKLRPDQVFLALSETIGHLAVLERAGRVRRDDGGTADRYVRTESGSAG